MFNGVGPGIPRALSVSVRKIRPLQESSPCRVPRTPRQTCADIKQFANCSTREESTSGLAVTSCSRTSWTKVPMLDGDHCRILLSIGFWPLRNDHAVAVFSGGSPGRSSSDPRTPRPWTCTRDLEVRMKLPYLSTKTASPKSTANPGHDVGVATTLLPTERSPPICWSSHSRPTGKYSLFDREV